jgi:transposase
MKTYYVGMDVHKATIVIAVLGANGKVVSQLIIKTSTQTVRDYLHSLRGEIHVTFEEGNHAAWLYDVIKPLVRHLVVCNPKHNRLLKKGSKNDRIDALKLAELLRLDALKSVYHGEHGTRTLKELVRCYECVVKDLTRVQNRLKALYNSRAIPNRGGELYRLSERESWIRKQENAGRQVRAGLLFRQMDELKALKRTARNAICSRRRNSDW